MSLAPLQSSLERLNILTTAMNWRGQWVSDEQYFQNDVVTSPINNGTYICSVSSFRSTIDPSTDAAWGEVSATSTGVASLQGGVGISIDSTNPNQPIINNEGVLTVAGGTSITVDNTDPMNPVISTTAIEAIAPGVGINIDNTIPTIPVISNTGVIQITGVDILVSGTQQNPTIINTGVVSVIGSAGIAVSSATGDVTITNTGVNTLAVVSPGISLGGTAQLPIIGNTGVVSVAAADSSIVIGGTAQNPTISAVTPKLTILYPALSFGGLSVIQPNYTGSLTFAQPAAPTFLTTTVAAPPAGFPNAAFMFDFSALVCYFIDSTPFAGTETISIKFFDSTTNTTYVPANFPNDLSIVASALSVSPPYPFPLCSAYYDIAEAYTAGMRVITNILIQNSTGNSISCLYSGSVYATYYPAGIV
jgi:hypothetical protein